MMDFDLKEGAMAEKFQTITELYESTAKAVTATPSHWGAFLTFACRNYRLPFDELLLIYAQRPDATAVLEIEWWNQRFGRWVNRGAKGIAVFDRERPTRLRYYFDVSDTHETRMSRPVPLWTVREEYALDIIETLENSFGELEHREDLGDALLSAAKNAVEDNMGDYLAELEQLTQGSLLEELDGDNLALQFRTVLGNSVAAMLLARCGIDPASYLEDEDFQDVGNFNTPETHNALGVATRDIARMCLDEIARTVISLERQAQKKIAHLQIPPQICMLKPENPKTYQKGANTMEVTYTMQGNYLMPDLLPPQEEPISLGKYARMRKRFLQEHRKITYTNLLTSGRLSSHLAEIQQTAQRRMAQIVAQMAKAQGVTEELKASDQMKWVQMMNNLRNAAEEIVQAELIYN